MNDFAQRWVNLASRKLGATAVACSDDFFAPMQRLIKDEPAVFVDGKYDDHGKWMDGWESRRRRGDGHDWCVVKLARGSVIHGVEIDTTHFTGNHPAAASLEACNCDSDTPHDDVIWREVIAKTKLKGDAEHAFNIADKKVYTHIRLNIFPDGGVARLRVYAQPKVAWAKLADDELIDLAAALNGAVALAANDQHYGAIGNLLTPGRGVNMGDGWETRRRRTPGNDWVIIALAHAGVVRKVEIDTAHFKGNYPDKCSIQAARLKTVSLKSIAGESETWQQLLPPMKLQADNIHEFQNEIISLGEVTHIRLNIHPDGGVSRLRLFGTVGKK